MHFPALTLLPAPNTPYFSDAVCQGDCPFGFVPTAHPFKPFPTLTSCRKCKALSGIEEGEGKCFGGLSSPQKLCSRVSTSKKMRDTMALPHFSLTTFRILETAVAAMEEAVAGGTGLGTISTHPLGQDLNLDQRLAGELFSCLTETIGPWVGVGGRGRQRRQLRN